VYRIEHEHEHEEKRSRVATLVWKFDTHSSHKFFFTTPPSPLMLFAVKLEVVVMPKRNVLDPQGVAVRNAVSELGLSNVGTVRVGKIIEIEFTGEPDEAKLDEICRDLLCNQVIEDYRILGAVLK
jgi:phosphoribosylformylglycinamidine synthase